MVSIFPLIPIYFRYIWEQREGGLLWSPLGPQMWEGVASYLSGTFFCLWFVLFFIYEWVRMRYFGGIYCSRTRVKVKDDGETRQRLNYLGDTHGREGFFRIFAFFSVFFFYLFLSLLGRLIDRQVGREGDR